MCGIKGVYTDPRHGDKWFIARVRKEIILCVKVADRLQGS